MNDILFNRVIATAQHCHTAGLRCPTEAEWRTHGVGNSSNVLRAMAKQGDIRVEIFGKNFRTVWLCRGPNRGMRTALPPKHYGAPYKVMGAERPR